MLSKCIGNYFVLRVSFALFVFFVILSVVTKCDPLFHNGQWFTKAFIYGLFLVGSFFIPNEVFYVYSYVARFGSFLFILFQLVIMVDYAFDWHEDMLLKMEQCENGEGNGNEEGSAVKTCGCCTCGLGGMKVVFLVVSFSHLLVGIVGSILLYVYFNGCDENVAIITVTLMAGILITITSVIQCRGGSSMDSGGQHSGGEHNDGSIGLLVPSLIFCYCVYYAFDSVKSNPNPECRPAALSVSSDDASAIILGLIVSAYSLSWVSLRTARSAKGVLQIRRESAVVSQQEERTLARNKKKKKKKKKKTTKENNHNQIEREDSDEEETGQAMTTDINVMEMEKGSKGGSKIDSEQVKEEKEKVKKDERDTKNKQIWLFHIILAMGALYLGMILTQWGGFTGMTQNENVANQATALWVNAVGGWVGYAIFGWIRVAPLLFPGRDFRDATDGF